MAIIPSNPTQLYHDVQKKSGAEVPLLHDFLQFALGKQDEKLVKALNVINERDFLYPDKLIRHLNRSYFKAKPVKNKSWVSKVLHARKKVLEKTI